MAKDKITDYDATAANNLDVGGISVAEGMLPSGVNNAIREQMSHLADFAAGTSGVDVLKLQDDTDTNSIKLQAPSSVTTTTTFTLPDGDGESGQTMITDGAGTLAWAAPYGNRNLIINGAMQVAQRGTSSTTNGYGSVDRFAVQYGGGTITHSQESLTSGSPYDNGFRKFLRATVTSAGSDAAADFCYLVQNVEAQNVAGSGWNYTSSSSYVTIQFWVRSSLAGTYYCVLKTVDGINRAFVIPVVLSANTWTKITQSISGDSNLQFDNDNGLGFEISVRPYVGTAYTDPSVNTTTWYTRSGTTQAPDYLQNWQSTGSATFDLTGVQLELGSSATPFEHRSFAEEWNRCQRYCTVYNVGGGNAHPQNLVSPNHPVPGAAGHVDVGNRAEWYMSYPVKRSQPTITVTDPTNMRWLANGNVVVDANGSVTFPVGTGHQNANVFQGVPSSISTSSVPEGWVYKGSGTNPVITIDAEL